MEPAKRYQISSEFTRALFLHIMFLCRISGILCRIITYAVNISLKGAHFLGVGNLEVARNTVRQNN